jgi:hypothetical protein
MFKRGISGMMGVGMGGWVVGLDGLDWTGLDGWMDGWMEYINVGSCGTFGQI